MSKKFLNPFSKGRLTIALLLLTTVLREEGVCKYSPPEECGIKGKPPCTCTILAKECFIRAQLCNLDGRCAGIVNYTCSIFGDDSDKTKPHNGVVNCQKAWAAGKSSTHICQDGIDGMKKDQQCSD